MPTCSGWARSARSRRGRQADIAVCALDHPRYAGLHDQAIGPVAAAGAPTLRRLYCAGREIVRDGAIPGLDMGALMREAAAAVAAMRQ